MCLNVALFCAVLKQKFASFSTIPSSYIVTKPVALAARSITWLLGRGQFSSILAHFFIVCSDSGLRAEIPCRSLLLVALVLIIHNATYLLTNFFPTRRNQRTDEWRQWLQPLLNDHVWIPRLHAEPPGSGQYDIQVNLNQHLREDMRR